MRQCSELRETDTIDMTSPSEVAERQVKPGKSREYVSDFQIETDLEIMFPDEYVSNISERIRLYKELNEINSEDALSAFSSRLTDRFGTPPPPAMALLDIVRIKWRAIKLGIEKILLKNNLLIANFISDPQSEYYRSQLFVSVMNYVNRHQGRMSVRQKSSKLSLTINNITSVKSAIEVLDKIILETGVKVE